MCIRDRLNVRVGDFAINDISNIRVTDSGSATTFENGDRIGVIVLDACLLYTSLLPRAE